MKYMKEWTIPPENFKAVIERFKENAEPFEGIKRLGRWHISGTNRGYELLETDDLVALSKYNLYWSDLSDQKIVPVIDDEEVVKALGW